MTDAPASAAPTVRCDGCERAIEVCAACFEAACPSPACYVCLVTGLGQTVTTPHDHGG